MRSAMTSFSLYADRRILTFGHGVGSVLRLSGAGRTLLNSQSNAGYPTYV